MELVDEKENLDKARCARTTKKQFDLLENFHQKNNAEVLDSIVYNQSWDLCVLHLNEVGPPQRSSNEWKRVWSERKYNKKRKRNADDLLPMSSKKSSDVQIETIQKNHFDEHICLPVNSLLQDCTSLFENVYGESPDSDQQIGSQISGPSNALHSIEQFPENPIYSFVEGKPPQHNSTDSHKMLELMSEISKKLDVVIDQLTVSNNLQMELLQKQ